MPTLTFHLKLNGTEPLVWTTLIIGYFTVDYQLVRFQWRAKLRNMQIISNQLYSPRNSKTMKRIIFDFWGNEDKSIQ